MSLESFSDQSHSVARPEHSFRQTSAFGEVPTPSRNAEAALNLTGQTHSDGLKNAEKQIVNSLIQNPNDMHAVSETLQALSSHESAELFKQDLTQINEDLHKLGYLPNLTIVSDDNSPDQFALRPRDGAAQLTPNVTPADTDFDRAVPNRVPDHRNADHPPRRRGEDHHGSERHHRHGGDDGRHHHERGGHVHHGGHHQNRHHRRHHSQGAGHGRHAFAGGAYDNLQKPDDLTLENSVKAVLKEAKDQNLSENATKAAVASMLVESQGNPEARGDRRNSKDASTATSFGLFQLHRGGELTEALGDGRLKNEQEAFDPQKNAHVALSYFKQQDNKNHDPGALAAAAQRPKDSSEYIAKVNSHIPEAERLIKKYSGANDGTSGNSDIPARSTSQQDDASSDFRMFMADRASQVASRLRGQQHGRVGNCAAGTRETFDPASNVSSQPTDDGLFHLPRGLTAVEQAKIYENHPEFFRALGPDEAPGLSDIGYRHWSERAIRQDPYAHGGEHKDRGDIFTVIGKGPNNTIYGANDHQFVVPPNGTHYSGEIKYFRPTKAYEEYFKTHFGGQS